MYDTIIIGGGPAGLSAALLLGRCRRRVVVCDAGEPRNAAARGLHGFLSRDGIPPADLLRRGRYELEPYGVEFRRVRVVDAACHGDTFDATLETGERLTSRTMLLATGVVDRLPAIDGFREFYGAGVFHCPYCDGWEVRDRSLAVYGRGRRGAGLCVSLKTWSDDVVLLTDGRARLGTGERDQLARRGIDVREARIARLEGGDHLERIVFANGERLDRHALFFTTGQYQRSALPARLGCGFNNKGTVKTNRLEMSNVPGLYVAGDASEDVQLVIIAAAEGAKAAFAINQRLQQVS